MTNKMGTKFLFFLSIVSSFMFSSFSAHCGFDGIDFSDLTLTNGKEYVLNDTLGYQYDFNICGFSSKTSCRNENGLMCQYSVENTSSLVSVIAEWKENSEDPNDGLWSRIQEFDKGYQVIYNNSAPTCEENNTRVLIVQFLCDENAKPYGNMSIETELFSCEYTLTIPTYKGCLLPQTIPNPGLSGGWFFVIFVCVVGFIYISIGCGYNYQQKQGENVTMVDLFPNKRLWSQLGNLVKEGFVYTGRKLKSCFSKEKKGGYTEF